MAWPMQSSVAGDDRVTLLDLPPAEAGHAAAVLCDGMGGHIGGAMASRTASEAFLAALMTAEGPLRHRLMHALDSANTALTEQVKRSPVYNGMGSTLVGVALSADGLQWVSVGDSLLYLWRQGEIIMLNEDHSLAPEIDKLAETGKISWAAARSDPRRHYLRSALTGDDIEMIDLSEEAAPLEVGDVIMLASDGVNTLEPETIASIISDRAAEGASAIAKRLIGSVDAIRAPHQDNTTIIIVRVVTAVVPDVAPSGAAAADAGGSDNV